MDKSGASKKRKSNGAAPPTKRAKNDAKAPPTSKSNRSQPKKGKNVSSAAAFNAAKGLGPRTRKRASDYMADSDDESVMMTKPDLTRDDEPAEPAKENGAPKKKAAAEKPESKVRTKPEKRAKQAEPEPEPESGDEEVALPSDSEEDEAEDQTAALLAGFSDSDEDEEDDKQIDGIVEVPQAPTSKELKQLSAKKEKESKDKPGTIYIGRIPHGFYPPQMHAYFSQFGTINKLRMARNKKTGRSKHYAFLEFESGEVAEIVAKTMNNYLLFGHILKVRVVPEEQLHKDLWKGANKRFKFVPRAAIERRRLEAGVTREQWERRIQREQQRRKKKLAQAEALGYSFVAPELKSVDEVPVRKAEKEEGKAENKEVEKKGPEKEAEKPRAIEEAKPADDPVTTAVRNAAKKGKKKRSAQKEAVAA